MKILYIIGNGFDISQGMKTSYRDFEEEYRKLKDTDPLIQKFKDNINPNDNLWVDLELALGGYTSNIYSTADFEKIYDDLYFGIEQYMQRQEDAYQPDASATDMFRKQMIMPELFLEPADAELLSQYIAQYTGQYPNQPIEVNVINFNYTTAFERTLAFEDHGVFRLNNRLAYCDQVCHVHGVLSQPPFMLGVDSPEQIASTLLRTDVDVVQNTIVKPLANQATRMNRDRQANRLIESADVIICFGSSLGITDRTWWRKVANRMRKNDVRLVIHHYSGKQHDARKKSRWLQPEINNVKNKFYESISTEFNDSGSANLRKEIDDRIFVALDKQLFHLDNN